MFQQDYQKFSPSVFHRTPEGYLTGKLCVTGAGVFRYLGDDNKFVGRLRSVDEVKKATESINCKPVTLRHPSTPVTLDNVDKLQVGMSANDASFDGLNNWVTITVTNKDAVDAIGVKHELVGAWNTGRSDITRENLAKLFKAGMFFPEAFGDIELDEPQKDADVERDSMSIVIDGLEKLIKNIRTQQNPKKATPTPKNSNSNSKSNNTSTPLKRSTFSLVLSFWRHTKLISSLLPSPSATRLSIFTDRFAFGSSRRRYACLVILKGSISFFWSFFLCRGVSGEIKKIS